MQLAFISNQQKLANDFLLAFQVFNYVAVICLSMCAKSFQSCPTLCDPMDCSLTPLSTRILQARILEWVAIPFSWDLPDPGIEPRFPALQAYSLSSELPAFGQC